MAIREIIKNKKYKIEVFIGRNGNKKIMHYETIYSGKKEALLRESEIKKTIKNGTYIEKTDLSFEEYLNVWLESQKNIWAPKTYFENKKLAKNISEKIGHIKLKDLNVKILEDYYYYLKKQVKVVKVNNQEKEVARFSDNTIQHYYTLINTALNKAIKWKYILMNPNSQIEKPKFRKKQIECYTPEEVEELIEVLKKADKI